jgi:hypothetical protein
LTKEYKNKKYMNTMADIRENDRGYKTRVFSITSNLKGKMQICIGRKYNEERNDLYNVYPVVNGEVGGRVAYYELPKDTDVSDPEKDFDVARFGEPKWINVGKPDEVVQTGKMDAPPPRKAKSSNFKQIQTITDGNCFFDTVLRARAGPPYKESTEAEIIALRKELGEYITKEAKDDVIKRYNDFHKKDEYDKIFADYHDELTEEGTALDEIQEDIEKRSQKENDPNINYENFKKWKPTPDPDGFLATELKDYFNGKNSLEGDAIYQQFLKNLLKSKVWASEFVVAKYQQMTNTKILFMQSGTFVFAPWTRDMGLEDIKDDTVFILSDYVNNHHFSLLVQIDPPISVFTHAELPDEIKRKLDDIKTFKEAESQKGRKAYADDLKKRAAAKNTLPPAEASASAIPADSNTLPPAGASASATPADSDSVVGLVSPVASTAASAASTKKETKKEVIRLDYDSSSSDSSSSDSSSSDVEPELNPTTQKVATPETPRKSKSPQATTEPEASQSAFKQYTEAELNTKNMKELKEILQSLKLKYKEKYSGVSSHVNNKPNMIRCILNPDDPICKTRKFLNDAGIPIPNDHPEKPRSKKIIPVTGSPDTDSDTGSKGGRRFTRRK